MDFYDRQGRWISMLRYVTLIECGGLRYKRVAHTTLPAQGVRVSTVWLGIDHNFWHEGPPVMFETMVFAIDSDQSLAMWRYATERDARKGHNQMVHLARTDQVDIYPWVDASSGTSGRDQPPA